MLTTKDTCDIHLIIVLILLQDSCVIGYRGVGYLVLSQMKAITAEKLRLIAFYLTLPNFKYLQFIILSSSLLLMKSVPCKVIYVLKPILDTSSVFVGGLLTSEVPYQTLSTWDCSLQQARLPEQYRLNHRK